MRSLPGRLAALCAVLLVCSCGRDPVLSPTATGSSSLAATSASNTSVVLTLRSGTESLAGVRVWARHASNAPGADWQPAGETDGRGKCTLPVRRAGSSYYHFKATNASGHLVGRWDSVPVNGGTETHLTLDTGGGREAHPIPHPMIRRFALPGGGEIEMVRVPAGRFTMGSPEAEPGRDSDEGPQTTVTLTEDFYLSRVEVTQDLWLRVMGTAPWRVFRDAAERVGMAGVTVAEDGPHYPVESAGWAGVEAFVDALNAHAGDEVYRLPTEAEWEYAARAGSGDGWSADRYGKMDAYGWVRGNTVDAGRPNAQPVGTKLPNRWGLFDLHGNVAEWVQDWYRPYRGGHLTDPQGPLTGIHADRGYRSKKVVRGGSFVDSAPRTADRDFADTQGMGSGIGFRLVRVVEAASPRVAGLR